MHLLVVFRAINNDLDSLAAHDSLECLFGLLELEAVSDKLGSGNSAGSNKLNSQLVVSKAVLSEDNPWQSAPWSKSRQWGK